MSGHSFEWPFIRVAIHSSGHSFEINLDLHMWLPQQGGARTEHMGGRDRPIERPVLIINLIILTISQRRRFDHQKGHTQVFDPLSGFGFRVSSSCFGLRVEG
jgi:hypothetical protein